jgi:glutaredoxin
MRRLVLIFLPILLIGCPQQDAKESPDGEVCEFEKLSITDEADHFLFTCLMADGSFETVEKIADVPAEARDQVIVIDTRLSPKKRRSSKIIYVADLTQKREDETYSCRPVSRFKFERDLLREPGNSSNVLPPECRNLVDSPKDRVIVYSTVWCGVCKATTEFLKKAGIPYEEKDVEKTAGAQHELACKALKTGKRINGVPVLDIAGTLLLGFDRDDILKLSKNLEKTKSQDQKQP